VSKNAQILWYNNTGRIAIVSVTGESFIATSKCCLHHSETSQIFLMQRNLLEKTGFGEHRSAYFTLAEASSPRDFSFLSFLGKKREKIISL